MNNEALPYIPLDNETPDEKMEKAFTKFIEEHGFSADEIRKSYEHLLGVESDTEVSPELLGEMQRLERDNFPINRFAEFSRTLDFVESAVPNFEQFVEELPVSFDEKYMLRSLVKKQRVGELEIFVNDTLEDKALITTEDASDQRGFALGLMERIKKQVDYAAANKLSISFQFKGIIRT